jgi:hypothetical protein
MYNFSISNIKEIIEVNKKCIETYPCRHYVKIKDIENEYNIILLDSITIYDICKLYNYNTSLHIKKSYHSTTRYRKYKKCIIL